jgi:hypothetical protein
LVPQSAAIRDKLRLNLIFSVLVAKANDVLRQPESENSECDQRSVRFNYYHTTILASTDDGTSTKRLFLWCHLFSESMQHLFDSATMGTTMQPALSAMSMIAATKAFFSFIKIIASGDGRVIRRDHETNITSHANKNKKI